MSQEPVHIITIKWGTKYSAHDVNRILSGIKTHTTLPVIFHCFTDNATHLNPQISTHPLPALSVGDAFKGYSYIKEAGLCDDDLGGLQGKRVFFFDLDVLICGPLDEAFHFPQKDDFVIINDWNTKGNHVGQASFYSWRVGTLGYVKDNYETHEAEIVKKFYTASQEYLSAMVMKRFGPLHFWPKDWCVSFKHHCLPPWYKRYVKAPTCPEGAKLIAFHGDPKPDNALIGRWSDNPTPFYKKLYKKNKPAPWLAHLMEGNS